MVKYFTSCGDERGSKMFTPYIWKNSGFGALIDKITLDKRYGNDLKLLLVKYYIEGEFSSASDLPSEPKVLNYSTKNKDIAVNLPVTRELFHDRNEFERREFIVDSTLNTVKLVRDKLKKKKLDIDFESLMKDITEISEEYLKRPEPYSKI